MSDVAAGAADRMKARLAAAYALSVYLPMSRAAAVIRGASRRLRGKQSSGTACISPIETVDWWKIVPRGAVRLVETEKRPRQCACFGARRSCAGCGTGRAWQRY